MYDVEIRFWTINLRIDSGRAVGLIIILEKPQT